MNEAESSEASGESAQTDSRHLDAIAQERLVRDAACLRLTETVGDFEIVPMALWHYTALKVMASPYLPPFRTPSPMQTVQILWLLSPDYSPGNKAGRKAIERKCWPFVPPLPPFWKTRRYESKCLKALIAHAHIVKHLRDYITETMQDAPPPVHRQGIAAPEYYCDEISISCMLAREFGGGLESYRSLPLKLAFQALKEIRENEYINRGLDPLMLNPSDAETDRELEAINRADTRPRWQPLNPESLN